eukprot:CAMPEP_0178997396 /NCGR_PEP_ID=MMETSP0795-20121207/8899_1 /TAXON_ID=88552 /ORGANISM="Amoebophrya sp., Strain Ameob2" /LENGTH=771 /DNA_ID=CAMNT_0020689889 /DNA_START=268 /DNA_END=2580 /DNA_ORIENTATION=+
MTIGGLGAGGYSLSAGQGDPRSSYNAYNAYEGSDQTAKKMYDLDHRSQQQNPNPNDYDYNQYSGMHNPQYSGHQNQQLHSAYNQQYQHPGNNYHAPNGVDMQNPTPLGSGGYFNGQQQSLLGGSGGYSTAQAGGPPQHQQHHSSAGSHSYNQYNSNSYPYGNSTTTPPPGVGAGGGQQPPVDALHWLIEKENQLIEQNALDLPPREFVNKTTLSSIPAWRLPADGSSSGTGRIESSTDAGDFRINQYLLGGGLEQTGGSSGSSSFGATSGSAGASTMKAAKGSPFAPDLELNTHVRLFCGDMASLEVDAIAFDFSYSSLSKGHGAKLLSLGGGKLVSELTNTERMRSGEAFLMKGNFGNLYCQKVLPFCGPNYKEKYTTAAKNTLSQCVRNMLQVCLEHKVKTVAFPVHYSVEKQFPLEKNLHIVLRTLRRWLPKVGGSVQCVVLYTEFGVEKELAAKLMQLYFPRNTKDSEEGMALVTSSGGPNQVNGTAGEREEKEAFSFGTETGEEIPDNQDRVLKVPDFVARRRQDDDSDDGGSGALATTSTTNGGLGAGASKEDDLRTFANEFNADWTEKEVARLDATLWDVESTGDLHHIYLRYLREAASPAYAPTMRELDRFEFLTYAGKDQLGRGIIVFSEALIPIARYDPELLIRYIVSRIEPYSNSPFMIVYAHGGMTTANAILEVWKELIRISQFKYSAKLQNLLVLHPTISFKAAFALLSYYMPENVYENSIYFESIAELTRWLNFPGLELAAVIKNYEQERNESLFGN